MSEPITIVVLPSPYGPLALSVQDFRAGLVAGRVLTDHPNADSLPCLNRDGEESKLLDAIGAAELLGVKPSWLLKRARENQLPYHRVGKYIRFEIDELLSFTRHFPDRHANS